MFRQNRVFSTSDLKFYFKTERAEIAQTCRISFIFPRVIVHFQVYIVFFDTLTLKVAYLTYLQSHLSDEATYIVHVHRLREFNLAEQLSDRSAYRATTYIFIVYLLKEFKSFKAKQSEPTCIPWFHRCKNVNITKQQAGIEKWAIFQFRLRKPFLYASPPPKKKVPKHINSLLLQIFPQD